MSKIFHFDDTIFIKIEQLISHFFNLIILENNIISFQEVANVEQHFFGHEIWPKKISN
jgi:hypothetical protein